MPFEELIAEKLKKSNQIQLEKIAEKLKKNNQIQLENIQDPGSPNHQRDESDSANTFGRMITISVPKPDRLNNSLLSPGLNPVEEESQEGEKEFDDDPSLQGTPHSRAGARRISKASLEGMGDSPKGPQGDSKSQYSKTMQLVSVHKNSVHEIQHQMELMSSEDKMADILSRFEDERDI